MSPYKVGEEKFKVGDVDMVLKNKDFQPFGSAKEPAPVYKNL